MDDFFTLSEHEIVISAKALLSECIEFKCRDTRLSLSQVHWVAQSQEVAQNPTVRVEVWVLSH